MKDGREVVAIGMGINLNMTTEYMENIDNPATSMLVELNRNILLEDFTETLYKLLIYWYRQAQDDGQDSVHQAWVRKCDMMNKKVTLIQDDKTELAGKVIAFHRDGSLELEFPDGSSKCYFSGNVSVKK